jgi:hypothetical protein
MYPAAPAALPLRRASPDPKADIAVADIRCNKRASEIADDLMASGPYRIGSQEQ